MASKKLTNHVHLIVDPGEDGGNLARLMKREAGRQTRYLNKLEKRTGSLLGLADNRKKRAKRYMEWVKGLIPEGEWELIRQSLQRGQLTGSARFVEEIEQKIERRVEFRGQGRPRKSKK